LLIERNTVRSGRLSAAPGHQPIERYDLLEGMRPMVRPKFLGSRRYLKHYGIYLARLYHPGASRKKR
jgi:hypothetical protein